MTFTKARIGKRAHPDLNQGPADLQSAALTTELCTHLLGSRDVEKLRVAGLALCTQVRRHVSGSAHGTQELGQ